jgi:hypothetical protein
MSAACAVTRSSKGRDMGKMTNDECGTGDKKL